MASTPAPLLEQETKRPPKAIEVSLRVVIALFFTGLSIAFFVPFYWMVVSSLKPVGEIFSRGFQLWPETITLNAYITLITQRPFLRWYFNSAVMTAAHTLLTLGISAAAGYALAKFRFRGSNVIFLVILSSQMIPFHLKLIPLFLQLNEYGLINTYAGVVLPGLAAPLGVFFMRQFMLSIDSDLLDAGRIDGASELRIFWKIVLPLTKPALGTLGVLTSLGFWNDLLWPLIVMRTQNMFPLAVGLASLTSTYRPQYDLLMAGSFLSVLPFILFYLVARRLFTSGLAISAGIKG